MTDITTAGIPLPGSPSAGPAPTMAQMAQEPADYTRPGYWRDAFREQAKQDAETWDLTMRAAIGTDPGVAAEADKLARQLGQPLLKAQEDPSFLRAVSVMKRMTDDRIQSTNPVLFRSFQGLEFARKAWDDYEHLSGMERWGNAVAKGSLMSERGRVASTLALGGDNLQGAAAADIAAARRRFVEIEQEMAKLGPTTGFLNNAGEILGQWGAQLPRAFGAGLAVGAVTGAAGLVAPPAAPLTFAAGFKAGFTAQLAVDVMRTEGGNAYADMVQAGYDPQRAFWAASGVGLVNSVLELAGASIATRAVRTEIAQRVTQRAVREVAKDVPGGFVSGYLREYGKGIAGEVTTELLQEMTNIVAEGAAAKGGEKDTSPDGIAARLWEVASKTVQGMAVLGIPGGVVGGMRAKVAQDAAKDAQERLREGQGIGASSKLNQRDSETASGFVGQVLNQGGIREAHVDASTLRDVLAKVDQEATAAGKLQKSALDILEGIVPGVSQQLQQALEVGGDVSVPLGDFVTRIQAEMPEFAALIAPNVRMDQEAPDLAADDKAQAEKQAAAADTGTEEQAAFYESLRKVEAETAAKIVETGGAQIGATGARAVARIYSAAIEQVAREERIDPAEAVKRYGATFQAADTGAARGQFNPQTLTVLFGKESSTTTALQELTHWFTEVTERLDRQGSAYGKAQFDVLLARWGKTREEWAGLDLNARRPFLEDIGYSAEEYFATGQAPSEDLRGVFGKLRTFIVGLYRNVRAMLAAGYRDEVGAELPPMTPELRGFFDRMLAADSAIEAENALRAGAARLSDAAAKAIGADAETLAEIRSLEQQATDEAKASLTAEALRGAQVFQSRRKGAEESVQRKLAEAKARIWAQVDKAVRGQPVYRAQAQVRYGTIIDENGQEQSAKLDTDAVRRIMGEDAAKLTAYTKQGGASPDLTAQQFGFGSGEEMLRAFIEAPPIEQAVDQQTAARLEAEEPLANPEAFKRAVEDALHGKTAARLLSTILRAMMQGTRESVAGLEAQAKEAARVALLRAPVGRINVRSFAQAERRAAQQRDRALASGDLDAAREAHRRLLVQHYLTVGAAKVEREIQRALATIDKRYGKADQAVIDEKRNLDIVNAGRLILGRFGLFPEQRTEAARADLETMARLDPDGWQSLRIRIAIATENARAWRMVPLDEFRTLIATADGMWSESHRSEQIRIAGVMRAVQGVRDELEDQTVQTFGGGTVAGLKMGHEIVPLSDWSWGAIEASLTRLEAWTVKMDGGKIGGPWHRYVYRPLKDATVAKDLEVAQHAQWFRDHLAKFDDLAGEKIDLRKFLGDSPHAVFENRAALIGALQHMGTESNFRNFILGHGFGEQVNGQLVTRWGEALQHLADKGRLTKRDFDLVQQGISYINENFRDRLFSTTREVWGFYPDAVEAMPFDTPFGRYPGGYFPSKVDKRYSRVGVRQQMQGVDQGRDEFARANRNVPRGVTISRVENSVEKRVTDLNLLPDHVDSVLSIIHLQPALSDIARLFRGRQNTMSATLSQAQPYAERRIILPAIERMARDSIVAPTDSMVADVANWVRQSASLFYLGFNPRNAAQQFTGLANAIPLVGGRVWSSFWETWRNPRKAFRNIEDVSDGMRNRWSDAMQLAAADIRQMLAPSTTGKIRTAATRAAFFLQRYAQMMTDATIWRAAYEKEAAAGIEHEESVQRADAVVRITQGEKTPLDVAPILSGNAIAQLFTQFGDYPNTVLNQNLSAAAGRRLATLTWTLLVPTLASSAIGLTLAFGKIGKGDRDDEDYNERLVKHLLGDQIRGAFGLVPVVGGTIGSIMNRLYGMTNDPGGMRNQPFAGWSVVDLVSRVGGGDAKFSDLLAVVAMGAGLPARPAVNVARYQERVESGREEQGDLVDYLRVLLSGR